VQVIKPAADEEQVFVVSVCDAFAVHVAGGPVTAVAVTVTFAEGEKPWADPFPEKYTPELSAAKLSSYVARLRRSAFIDATYAFSFVFANFGIAIAARMPMMTTTMRSSISVKPFLRDMGAP
jgi:hypothetical protein